MSNIWLLFSVLVLILFLHLFFGFGFTGEAPILVSIAFTFLLILIFLSHFINKNVKEEMVSWQKKIDYAFLLIIVFGMSLYMLYRLNFENTLDYSSYEVFLLIVTLSYGIKMLFDIILVKRKI